VDVVEPLPEGISTVMKRQLHKRLPCILWKRFLSLLNLIM